MLIATGVLVMLGCGRASSTRAGTTVTTAAHFKPRMILNDDAAMIVTKARCDREIQCEDVGVTGRFVDRKTCLHELMPQDYTVVSAESCPAGVDEQKLSSCADELLTELSQQGLLQGWSGAAITCGSTSSFRCAP